jgi:acetolactate synthase-1/2/3 large subunit
MARAGLERTLQGKVVVSVHFEPSFVEGTQVEIAGHVRESLRALLERLGPTPRVPTSPAEPEEHRPPLFLPGRPRTGPSFREVLSALATELPDDANIFVDAGNTGASAIHYLKSPRRGRFVVALGMGGMGYTFGAAIGAAFANRRRTFVLAGDGAFFMHGLEIHTAVEHELPITFVLLNNNAHAMCYARERLYYGEQYTYNLFKPSHLGAGMAAMFPSLAVSSARTATEIRQALRDHRTAHGPAVLSVDVDAAEVPPFAPFVEALSGSELRGANEDRSRKAS